MVGVEAGVRAAVAMKLSHAAIVADGYVYVNCVVPDPK